jgi:hypothetical protein
VSALTIHYRRRRLSGQTSVSSSIVQALTRRSDRRAWVYDYRLAHSAYTTPVQGRRGDSIITIERPEPVATRLWLWPNRPLRLHQQFGADGRPTLFRIDFASFPHRNRRSLYQTDLYLDMFVTADQRDYAILDEDELAEAHQRELIGDEMRERVLAQAGELVDLLEAGRFGAWLQTVCDAPFELERLPDKQSWDYRKYAPGEHDGWPAGVA